MKILQKLMTWFYKATEREQSRYTSIQRKSVYNEPSFHVRLRKQKQTVIALSILRVTPGKRHAWINSNVGIIRKPLGRFAVRRGF